MPVIKIITSNQTIVKYKIYPKIMLLGIMTSNWRDKVIHELNKLKQDMVVIDPTNNNYDKADFDLAKQTAWEQDMMSLATINFFYLPLTDRSQGNASKTEFGIAVTDFPERVILCYEPSSKIDYLKAIAKYKNVKTAASLETGIKQLKTYLNQVYPLVAQKKFEKIVKVMNAVVKKGNKKLYDTVKEAIKRKMLNMLAVDTKIKEALKPYKKEVKAYELYLVRHIYRTALLFYALNKYCSIGFNPILSSIANHDDSKFTIFEFVPYLVKYYLNEKQIKSLSKRLEPIFLDTEAAWIEHVMNSKNSHHWNHGVILDDSGKVNCSRKMYYDLLEMVADWMSVSYFYNKTCDIRIWASTTEIYFKKEAWDFLEEKFGIVRGMFKKGYVCGEV